MPRVNHRNDNWFRLGVFILALAGTMFLAPDAALATGGNLQSVADAVLGVLTGGLARTIAVLAVMFAGFLFFTGRANIAVLITVIIGVAIVFSAEWIVSTLVG